VYLRAREHLICVYFNSLFWKLRARKSRTSDAYQWLRADNVYNPPARNTLTTACVSTRGKVRASRIRTHCAHACLLRARASSDYLCFDEEPCSNRKRTLV